MCEQAPTVARKDVRYLRADVTGDIVVLGTELRSSAGTASTLTT